MTVADQVAEHMRRLPESTQARVLDLVMDMEARLAPPEDRDWSRFSLEQACRGMEDEADLYTDVDLKKSFSRS